MIVLDTNVLSELMKPAPEAKVLHWVAARPAASLFTTTVTQAEILYGAGLLPEGRRKSALGAAIAEMFAQDFAGRILPFDGAAAHAYAGLAVARRRAGLPISHFDAQIAAICRSRDATLATRNTRDFTDCGIDICNPWGE
jgi:predicted nucleic acid-binding protein